jgi:hypothetical protein
VLLDDGSFKGGDDLKTRIGHVRLGRELRQVFVGESQGVELLLGGAQLDSGLGENLIGLEIVLLGGNPLFPEVLFPGEAGPGEREFLCCVKKRRLGVCEFPALQHGHDLALADAIPQALSYFPHDPGDARNDVRETVGVGDDLPGEADLNLQGSRSRRADLDAELLQLSVAEPDDAFFSAFIVLPGFLVSGTLLMASFFPRRGSGRRLRPELLERHRRHDDSRRSGSGDDRRLFVSHCVTPCLVSCIWPADSGILPIALSRSATALW